MPRFAFVAQSRLYLGGDDGKMLEITSRFGEGIRERCKATLGVGITGIAGPGGGSEEKPVGLVFHALADGMNTEVVERKFFGDRDRVRQWATQQALDMIRRKLM